LWLALAALALMPALPVVAQQGGGAYVGSDTCYECHDPAGLGEHNVHMRIGSFEVQGREVGCEGCHGAGEAHVEEGDATLIRRFDGDDDGSSDVCMSCHRTKKLGEWHASAHAADGIGCRTCHSIHEERSPESACATCHAESVARFRLPSHHPVREGKMNCSSCHNVHSATESMLATRMRKNDLCFDCHQEKEGPFIFEHAPVEEDCSICHTPHGSVVNNLLTANEPMLCVQCHDFHFHAGYRASDDPEQEVGGQPRENPFGAQGFNIAFTTSCTQCHSRVHGSDTPSQTVTGQGQGLTH
jgi:DmsE family decaheme c-type cytochrome